MRKNLKTIAIASSAALIATSIVAWAAETNFLGTVFIADPTTPSQQLKVNSDGSLTHQTPPPRHCMWRGMKAGPPLSKPRRLPTLRTRRANRSAACSRSRCCVSLAAAVCSNNPGHVRWRRHPTLQVRAWDRMPTNAASPAPTTRPMRTALAQLAVRSALTNPTCFPAFRRASRCRTSQHDGRRQDLRVDHASAADLEESRWHAPVNLYVCL